jgi:hypothetical protein
MLGTFLRGATAAKPIEFVSSASAIFTGSSGAVTVTTPTTAAGDYMIAFQFCNIENTNTTVPSGWTQIFKDASATNTLIIFNRAAVFSEPASHSFNVTTSGTSRNSVGLLVYRNAASQTVGAITRANSLTITASSITSAPKGTLLAAFFWEGVSQPITTAPSGMTSRVSSGAGGASQHVYDETWGGGTTGNRTADYTGTVRDTAGIQVVLTQ